MRNTIRITLAVCLLLSLAAAAFAQGQPKTVYVKVWNGNGTDYPTGATGENGLTFSCRLEDASNGWTSSDEYTQLDNGFDYLVYGGEYPDHSVHHISIQCANFRPFEWEPGDRLIIEAADVEEPFSGQAHTCTVVLESDQGDQYASPDFALHTDLTWFAAACSDVEFVDEDLDPADPYITRDEDSLFVADNDCSLTFVWRSWEPAGALSYEVTARTSDPDEIVITQTAQDTSFVVAGEAEKTYYVEVSPLSASGDKLATLVSRPVLCAPATLDRPGKAEAVGYGDAP